ncbi:MAG TPA: (d)CMP kinase [Ktedonobacterales bacterium]
MGDESREGQTAQIAIDGAAGAGKSTVGEAVAGRLGYLYIDSGAFYRALTVVALRRGVPVEDEAALAALIAAEPIQITRPTIADGRQYTVLAGGEDITPEIHTLPVAGNVSAVARHPKVREALIAAMREMADKHNVVMVGRDIGLVVLPGATLKIALSAPPEERARRRHADLVEDMGESAPELERVLADIEERDHRDAGQMTLAADAVPVENRDGQFEAVVDQIVALLETRLAPRAEAATQEAATQVVTVPAVTAEPSAHIAPAAQVAHVTQGKPRGANREGAYVAPKVTASRAVTHDGTATPSFYTLMRAVATVIFPALFKLRIEGGEHVPASGAVMLASNHAAWIDIPLLSFAVPRITHYMAKVELFTLPVIGGMIRLLGAFPVRRGEGDRESLKNAVRLLKEGEIVNIFPEGHRSNGQLIRGLPGVALIALMADAPVVPVAIINSRAVFHGFRPTVIVRYGEPFMVARSGARSTKDDVERGGDEIMTRIAELMPPEYRGVYAEAVAAREAARQTSPATM